MTMTETLAAVVFVVGLAVALLAVVGLAVGCALLWRRVVQAEADRATAGAALDERLRDIEQGQVNLAAWLRANGRPKGSRDDEGDDGSPGTPAGMDPEIIDSLEGVGGDPVGRRPKTFEAGPPRPNKG